MPPQTPPYQPPQQQPYAAPQFGEGSINQVSSELGRLSAHVENLQFDVSEGNESRRRMYEKMEESNRLLNTTNSSVTTLANTVVTLATTVAKIEPIVADYKANKSKAAGFILAMTLFGSAAGWMLAHFKDFVVHALAGYG